MKPTYQDLSSGNGYVTIGESADQTSAQAITGYMGISRQKTGAVSKKVPGTPAGFSRPLWAFSEWRVIRPKVPGTGLQDKFRGVHHALPTTSIAERPRFTCWP
jgi:hypothetical protein